MRQDVNPREHEHSNDLLTRQRAYACEYAKQYYSEHREEILAKKRARYAALGDTLRKQKKEYYQAHSEERHERDKRYYREHKVERSAQMRKYYAEHRDEILARDRAKKDAGGFEG